MFDLSVKEQRPTPRNASPAQDVRDMSPLPPEVSIARYHVVSTQITRTQAPTRLRTCRSVGV